MERVLVIAAHPDDEVLGCGGTIPLLAEKAEVYIVILGEGMSSRYDQREATSRGELERLRDDAARAAQLLGARWVQFGGLADNRFDELSLLDVVKVVEGWVNEVQPSTVYTHHPGDLNIDHLVTFRAVLTATRPMRGCPVRELYTFEVPSSTEWAFQRLEPAFRPNVFRDISATIETKLKAMHQYTTEERAFPHPRSPEALRAIAQRWGSVVGTDYAEAFELIRSVA